MHRVVGTAEETRPMRTNLFAKRTLLWSSRGNSMRCAVDPYVLRIVDVDPKWIARLDVAIAHSRIRLCAGDLSRRCTGVLHALESVAAGLGPVFRQRHAHLGSSQGRRTQRCQQQPTPSDSHRHPQHRTRSVHSITRTRASAMSALLPRVGTSDDPRIGLVRSLHRPQL
jgi:hypothetical protein